tara:strand:- start:304 stop:1269 length:966 start_codon:yes stop_codon:yes gene_type:complete
MVLIDRKDGKTLISKISNTTTTQNNFPAGFYEVNISYTPELTATFEKKPLLNVKEARMPRINKNPFLQVRNDWASAFKRDSEDKETAVRGGFKHGFLLHGSRGGTGKSILAKQLCNDAIELNNSIVIKLPRNSDVSEWGKIISIIREADSPTEEEKAMLWNAKGIKTTQRKIIFYQDECSETLAQSSALKDLLDGNPVFNNCIFIGCMNSKPENYSLALFRAGRVHRNYEFKNTPKELHRAVILDAMQSLNAYIDDDAIENLVERAYAMSLTPSDVVQAILDLATEPSDYSEPYLQNYNKVRERKMRNARMNATKEVENLE